MWVLLQLSEGTLPADLTDNVRKTKSRKTLSFSSKKFSARGTRNRMTKNIMTVFND